MDVQSGLLGFERGLFVCIAQARRNLTETWICLDAGSFAAQCNCDDLLTLCVFVLCGVVSRHVLRGGGDARQPGVPQSAHRGRRHGNDLGPSVQSVCPARPSFVTVALVGVPKHRRPTTRRASTAFAPRCRGSSPSNSARTCVLPVLILFPCLLVQTDARAPSGTAPMRLC